MVPIWVKEPIGGANCRRMASTPAIKVVATAPMPGIRIPSLPLGSAISTNFLATLSVLLRDKEQSDHQPKRSDHAATEQYLQRVLQIFTRRAGMPERP